jgi:hypothetical protein
MVADVTQTVSLHRIDIWQSSGLKRPFLKVVRGFAA